MITGKFIKIDLKNKIIASLIGFLAVIFGLIYFVVVPTITDIKTMGSEIEAQKIDLEKKYIKGQSLRQLTENLKKIEPKLDLLDQIFINKNRELEFITSLENQAANNQVAQKINLNSAQPAASREFQKNSLQLFTTGGFIEQLSYLISLESLSYYINIKLLELTLASEGGPTAANANETKPEPIEPNRINMLINADTYWQ